MSTTTGHSAFERNDQPASSAATQRRQFTLRGLLRVTTFAAVISAIVAANGTAGAFFCTGVAGCWAIVAGVRGRGALCALAGLVVTIGSVFAIPFGPLTHFKFDSHEVCTQCGLRRSTHSEGLIARRASAPVRETRYDTTLSLWFNDHFGDCAHEWSVESSSGGGHSKLFGMRLMTMCGLGGGTSRTHAVELQEDEQLELDRLFAVDPESCRDWITERLTD
jgi:hypothetical protein